MVEGKKTKAEKTRGKWRWKTNTIQRKGKTGVIHSHKCCCQRVEKQNNTMQTEWDKHQSVIELDPLNHTQTRDTQKVSLKLMYVQTYPLCVWVWRYLKKKTRAHTVDRGRLCPGQSHTANEHNKRPQGRGGETREAVRGGGRSHCDQTAQCSLVRWHPIVLTYRSVSLEVCNPHLSGVVYHLIIPKFSF